MLNFLFIVLLFVVFFCFLGFFFFLVFFCVFFFKCSNTVYNDARVNIDYRYLLM